ncbi:hypothetical protein [Nocardia sp. NPDC004604]
MTSENVWLAVVRTKRGDLFPHLPVQSERDLGLDTHEVPQAPETPRA